MDESFDSKVVYLVKEVRKLMVNSTPIEQRCVFERFMMNVFSETFNTDLNLSGRFSPSFLICVQLSSAGNYCLGGTWTRSRHDARDDFDGGVHGRSCQPWVNPTNMPVAPFC